MADYIRAQVPSAKVHGTIANSGDFEIFANGTQIFSKQATGGFPNETAVVEMIKNISEGREAKMVTKTEGATCAVL